MADDAFNAATEGDPMISCDKVAGECPGAEGPATDGAGRLWFVSPSLGEIRALGENGTWRVVGRCSKPAGLQLDRRGDIWIADMQQGILRLNSDGVVVEEVCEFANTRIRGCNDLCFDHTENLYFTAPAGSSADDPVGEVFVRLASSDTHRLDGGFAFCNGIAVTLDGRRLYVAETMTRSIWTYEISVPGTVGKKELFAVLPGTHRVGPDGIDLDAAGNLISSNYGEGSLDVFAPDGTLVKRLHLPFKKVSNLHFEKPGSHWVFVTEHESSAVWKLDYGQPGQAQTGWSNPSSPLPSDQII